MSASTYVFFFALLAAAIAIAFCVLLLYSIRRIRKHSARGWHATRGHVEGVNICSVGSDQHLAQIAYSYSVNKKTYNSTFRVLFVDYSEAGKFAHSLHKSKIHVLYDAREPENSVVEEYE